MKPTPNTANSLASFHPASRAWFEGRFGTPTPAQSEAWGHIAAGSHTLIAAPTGSGKTLAAFYAAIDALLKRGEANTLGDGVQIVYVSPLKALSNDIRKNLEEPLDGIAEQLHLQGRAPVDIRIAVRTGDTPPSERARMAKKPPHILVTTPESLYLLLTSASGRAMLSSARSLIVDEIHALLGDKRGSHLALSIERLQHLINSGDGRSLQRIGLSATQKPIELVANYLVGSGAQACAIVDSGYRRALDIRIEVPGSPLSALMSNEVWEELYARLVELIDSHDTTLVFVNTRRLSERLALALAERLGDDVVCSHHGSMSKDHRHNAEQRLKSGSLKVLVATASMELGIDVGSVDLVVQFSSPKSIATFLQRVGRSGHSIGGTPKGILFPLTRDDLIEATAMVHSIRRGELDAIVMPEKPLDILAQQIVAEVSAQVHDRGRETQSHEVDDTDDLSDAPLSPLDSWCVDELYTLVTRAFPFRELTPEEFEDTLRMVADGYTSRRGRRGAHLHYDAINRRLRPRRGANLISLTNGGAIPDMFDYQVVLDPEDTVVGSLNEDFALDSLPGDIFTLGTHAWQIIRVDGLKVRVRDAQGQSPTVPFWFGEGPGRTVELSTAVSDFRHTIGELLLDESSDAATRWCMEVAGLPAAAAVQVVDYLQSGMQALGAMPTRETIVMERFFDEVGDMHVVIHSPFGSRINRGWGLALRKRFCKSFNFELQAAANEDSIVISLGSVHSFPLEEVFRYLQTTTVRDVLIQALLDSPMFEVRWRWNATRSLAIQRNRAGKRVPPQFQRMDAEDLIAHVFPDQIACAENLTGRRDVPTHPLVDQTIHDCLTEAMDIDALIELVGKIERQELTLIAKDLREPSPFAQEIINARPYAFLDDAPAEERRTNAIRNRSWTDPAEERDYSLLDPEAIARVREEAWPLVHNAEELHDALQSLGYLTAAEFADNDFARWQGTLEQQGRLLTLKDHPQGLVFATENLPRMRALFPEATVNCEMPVFLKGEESEPEAALRDLLRARLEGLGPVTAPQLADEIALPLAKVDAALIALEVEGFAFQGRFSSAAQSQSATPIEWCERRLLQRIHRYTIDSHRKAIKPVSLQTYTLFLFEQQGLRPVREALMDRDAAAMERLIAPPRGAEPALDGQTQLQRTLSMLDGISAPAASWEADLYPGRVADYDPNWLDVMCISGRVTWGRYVQPTASQKALHKGRSGPVKTTPIALMSRANLDIWQALARAQQEQRKDGADKASSLASLSSLAQRVEADLATNGASFFDECLARTRLLKAQLEEGLAELVSAGRVSSDSFTGLRALLTPAKKAGGARRRRSPLFGIEDAGRWSLMAGPSRHGEQDEDASGGADTAARNRLSANTGFTALDDDQLERLVSIYLNRWGVLFRGSLEREHLAPPWRVMLRVLRRMELRGTVRGGRFVAGVGGEQFAFQETVDGLRRKAKETPAASPSAPAQKAAQPTYHSLAATDPLNLLNLILPTRKLPKLLNNRVLFEDGIPIAVIDAGEVKFLREVAPERKWALQQALVQKHFPPRLRSYLGNGRAKLGA